MLQKNQRFLNEYQVFSNKIKLLPDEDTKNEAERLLKDLVAEVVRLDQNYQELAFNRQLPDNINQCRDNLLQIRKKLYKILKI